MVEFFRNGGVVMWPVLVLGLISIGASLQYAFQPERRFLPVIIALGASTLLMGGLGFFSGVAKSLLYLAEVKADERWISLLGLGESLSNMILAFALAALAALAVTVGTWRMSRAPQLQHS